MKALVILYDEEQIKNLVAAYQEQHDKIIFLYRDDQEESIQKSPIRNYLRSEVEFRKYKTSKLWEELEKINQEFESVSIDIFGGDDYAISICGKFAGEHSIRLLYPDIKNNKLRITWHDMTYTSQLMYPILTVKQYIELMGASITGEEEMKFLEEDKKIVTACITAKRRTNQNVWASFCKYMQTNKEKGKYYFIPARKYKQYQTVLNILYNAGMFSRFENEKGNLKIQFAKPYFHKLVVDTGLALEYETYHQLVSSELFDDVDIRVNIDWNGGDLEMGDATSEIDIIAIKNINIFFISCKMGKISEYTIYDVYANADRFGGKTAIPVLIHDAKDDARELENKAEELGVLLIQQNTIADKTIATRIAKHYRKLFVL